MIKNAFYFILKALFVLRTFKSLSWLFGHVEKTTFLEREHSKSTFAQDLKTCSPLVVFEHPICHDFPIPDLLEGPKDGKIKENAKLFFILKSSKKYTTLVNLNADHKVHIIYNQWISSHFCWKCAKKIMDSAEKRTRSCAK